MNKLINKLAIQAEIWSNQFEEHWGDCPDTRELFKEKFAELIVRECARKIGDLMDFTDYPNDTEKSMVELKTLRDARQVIKEHFGVK